MGCMCNRPSLSVPPPQKRRISSVEEIRISPGLFIHSSPCTFESHYEVTLDHLGKGAFCEVRKCVHRRTGATRAVKIINKHILASESCVSFVQEIEILKRLDHPNILRVFEVYEDDVNYYMVMEYCTGGELFDMILNRQRIFEDEAAGIMEQLFTAVTYLHSNQIVHRDLKPENILLSSTNDQDRPHLTIIDFETAALMDVKHQLTGSFGTVYYIAPEVLDGKYDEKCDLWSLGVIMYILLTGKPPFDGQTERHIVRNVKRAEYTLEGPEWEYVSPEAKDLVQKLLMKNPKVRISAREAVLHPWIQIFSRKQVPSNAICREVLGNLKSFYHLNKLKGAIHTFILTQVMDQQEVREMREMFTHMDKDRDGVITVQDLIEQIHVLKPLEDSREHVQQLLQRMDLQESNQLNYTEFLRVTINRNLVLNKKNLKKAFDMFDEDGNGFVTREEISDWLNGGLQVEDQVLAELMEQMDKDGDGMIELKDFEELVESAGKEE